MNYLRAIYHGANLFPHLRKPPWDSAMPVRYVRSGVARTSRRGAGMRSYRAQVAMASGRVRRRRRFGRRSRVGRSRRSWRRRVRSLRGAGGLQAPDRLIRRTKVSLVEPFQLGSAFSTGEYNQSLTFNMTVSDLITISNLQPPGPCPGAPCDANVARVPQFYWAARDWKSFRVTGMRLKIIARPVNVAGGGPGSLVRWSVGDLGNADGRGGAFSITGERYTTATPISQYIQPGIGVVYQSVAEAWLDPTFKRAGFKHGGAVAGMQRRKPFTVFSRYLKMQRFRQTVGVEENLIGTVADQTAQYPCITGGQVDSFIQFHIPNLTFTAPPVKTDPALVPVVFPYWIKRTWYVEFGNKRNDKDFIPPCYKPAGMQFRPIIGDEVLGVVSPDLVPGPCDRGGESCVP